MKVTKWIKKNGEVKIDKVYSGKDWEGIRFYLDAPKGAFVDYKSNTLKLSQSRSYKLGEWVDCFDYELKYELEK